MRSFQNISHNLNPHALVLMLVACVLRTLVYAFNVLPQGCKVGGIADNGWRLEEVRESFEVLGILGLETILRGVIRSTGIQSS